MTLLLIVLFLQFRLCDLIIKTEGVDNLPYQSPFKEREILGIREIVIFRIITDEVSKFKFYSI